MTEKSKMPMTELFEQAMKNYETALKTGVKMQEESSKWLANLYGQAPVAPDYLKQMQAMVEETIPAVQKRMEESLKMVEQSNKNGAELLKKAIEAAKSTSMEEAQTRVQDFWQASLGSFQTNLNLLTQTQMKTWDSWSEFVRKAGKTVTPVAPVSAAK